MSEDEKTQTEKSSTSSEPRVTKLTRPQRMRRSVTVPDDEVPRKAGDASQPPHGEAEEAGQAESPESTPAPTPEALQARPAARRDSDEPELTVQETTFRDVASAMADAGFSLLSIRRAEDLGEGSEATASGSSSARSSSPPSSSEGRTTDRRYAGYPASWWPPPVRSTPPPPADKRPSFPPVGSFGPGPSAPPKEKHDSDAPRSRKATVPNPHGKPRRAPEIRNARQSSQPPPAADKAWPSQPPPAADKERPSQPPPAADKERPSQPPPAADKERPSQPQASEPPEPILQELDTEATAEERGASEQGPPSPPPAPPDEATRRARGSKPPPPPAGAQVSKPPRHSSRRKPRPLAGFGLQSVKPEPIPGSREWWEAFFSNEFLHSMIPPSDAQVARECDFVEAALELSPGSAILDVGCGLGMHASELASRGHVVVGVDIAATMVARATAEAQTRGVTARFVHADIRDVIFEGEFDAAICLNTTFGFYDDDANRDVMGAMHDALRPGGRILVDVVNRDFVVRNQPDMHWFEGPSYVCMEETEFNFYTSRLHVKRTLMHQDGAQREHAYSIRLFSLHELGLLMHRLGFRVIEASGHRATRGVFFGADSVHLILLAERRNGAPNTAEMPKPPPATESTADEKSADEEPGMMQLSEDDIEHAEPVSDRPATEPSESKPDVSPTGANEGADASRSPAEPEDDTPDGDTDPPEAEDEDEPQMVGVAPILQILPSLRPQSPESENESDGSWEPGDESSKSGDDESSKSGDDNESS